MLIQKGNREDAIEALINTWLKDGRKRCGWCGEEYTEGQPPCCEKPFIGTNAEIMRQFYREVKDRRGDLKDSFGTTGNKNTGMRIMMSFPPDLLRFLEISMVRLYQENLFTKEYDTTWFARKFGKYFAVPERI